MRKIPFAGIEHSSQRVRELRGTFELPGRPALHLLLCTEVLIIHLVCAVLRVLEVYGITGRPGSSEVPRNPLTRWDVSSIPANGIFLTKKLKNKNKNAQRVEND